MLLSANTNSYSGRAQLLAKQLEEAVNLISWLLLELEQGCFYSTELGLGIMSMLYQYSDIRLRFCIVIY